MRSLNVKYINVDRWMLEVLHVGEALFYYLLLRKQTPLCNNLLMYSRRKIPISLSVQIVGTFTVHVCMEQNVMSTQCKTSRLLRYFLR
jgi:hypothetical protein